MRLPTTLTMRHRVLIPSLGPLARRDVHNMLASRYLPAGCALPLAKLARHLATTSRDFERDDFFNHVKSRDVASAWASYLHATEADAVDKYMLNALVGLVGKKRRPHMLLQLWRAMCELRHPAVPLDAHLSSNFIVAFGVNRDLDMSRDVMMSARAAGAVTTRVQNSFLATLLRTSGESTAGVVEEAARVLQEMETSPTAGLDSYSVALATALYGRADRLQDARGLIERCEGLTDTVVLNTLIDVCGRQGDVHLALATLERMEEEGPPPDEFSYTAALQALVKAPVHSSMPIDRVAMADELRDRMRRQGVEESAATRTSLLTLFSDTVLGESVLREGKALNPNQHFPKVLNVPDDARFVTDLRGLTRQAVSITLRQDLHKTGQAREQGTGACGYGGCWAIITGTPAAHTKARSHPHPHPHTKAGPSPVTASTAVEFFTAEGIAYRRQRGLLVVDASELERAAAEAARRTRQQHVRQGLLLQLGVVASGLAAMSIVPRMVQWG